MRFSTAGYMCFTQTRVILNPAVAQIYYYKLYVIICMIRCVSYVSANFHRSTPYDSYQSILSRTINNTVFTRIVFPLTPLFQQNLLISILSTL